MARIFLWSAAILSLGGLLAHELVGAPMVLPPLSDADLPANVVWLHHFSWHVGSIALLAMIAMFVITAQRGDDPTMAIIATCMSLGYAVLAVSLAMWGDEALWTSPAPYIWWPIALLGGLGSMTLKRRP